MNTASEQQILNDDGTPRRRYEIEEQQESRHFFSANVGLVLASIVIYVKNLLFGEEKAEANIARSTGSRTVGDSVIAGDEALEDVIPDKGENGQLHEINDDPSEENPGFPKLLFTNTSDSYAARTPYTPFKTASLVPANDNMDIKILDAVFGSLFTRFPDGGLSIPRLAAGGNASGGGNYDGSGSGDEEEEDEDEDPRQANRRPVVTDPVYLGSFLMNQVAIIALADLLRNVSDPDGDPLSVRELLTSSGKVTARTDGSWAFSPDLDDTTDVTFTYTISDGKGGTAQTASLDLVPAPDQPIESADGGNSIAGTHVTDALGGGGTITGQEGNDVIHGGDGDDRIFAGDGDDVVYGGAGNDVVYAGAGRDTVFAGIGNDTVFGEEGDDALFGEAGNDTVSGDAGDDTIAGGEGDDSLTGGTGNDLIDGGAGVDSVDGGEGQDIILAAAGDDTASGGSGDDRFIAVAGDGNDAYDGGEGTDTYDISATSADAIVDLRAGTASSDEIGGDYIDNIENVQSGSGNDTIAGGEGEDSLAGGAGNDLIDGGAGIDSIDGGEGQDIILAAAGDDTASGGSGDDLFIAVTGDGNDVYDGGEGTDTYDISATSADAIVDLRAGTASSDEIGGDCIDNIENVQCGSGNDTVFASESVNIFSGGEGNDTFLFGTVAAIGMGHGSRDRILDFAVGDRIDLDDISAEFAEAVDATFEDQQIQRFVLIREQDQFTRPGEIKFSYGTFDGSPVTIIQGNIDYDEEAEFELELAGIYELKDEDFHSNA